eukprot:729831-Prymnesium_polylepis.3
MGQDGSGWDRWGCIPNEICEKSVDGALQAHYTCRSCPHCWATSHPGSAQSGGCRGAGVWTHIV